ncbi:MAG TPA: GGDEF domain-containing protein [Thermoanaerobaculia bacterium]|nr:GGDEF domain-containing protein [Thermoanaerobaculia bacterium]
MTYDGAWWSVVELPRSAPALSLFVDGKDRIDVGSVDDFGVLEPDAQGNLHYRSLLQTLPPAQRASLGEFDYVIADGAGLVFVSQKIVVAWNGRTSKVLLDAREHPAPHRPFFSRGKLLFGTRDGLQDLGGGKSFAGRRVDAVTDTFVNVRDVGLFTRDGKAVAGSGAAWIKGKLVMDSCTLRDGRSVFTTLRDGVAIIDAAGNLDTVINREAGLPEALAYAAREDREGSLWIVHDLGMTRVDLASPLTVIDSRSGLRGSTHDVLRHGGRLYAASSHGLFAIDDRVAAIAGVDSPWCIVPVDDELLVGTDAGAYRIRGNEKPRRIAGTEQLLIYAIAVAPGDRNLVYLGLTDGLGLLRRNGEGWRYAGLAPHGKAYVRTFLEQGGALWCGTSYDGALRIDRDGSMHPFGGGDLTPFLIGNRVVFTTGEGGGRFLQLGPSPGLRPPSPPGGGRGAGGEGLVADPLLGGTRAPGRWDTAAADAAGNVWINTAPPSVIRKLANGRYELAARSPISMPAGDIETMRLDEDGTILIAGDHGLFRISPAAAQRIAPPPAPVIRRITRGNGRMLFGGYGAAHAVELPHAFQRLRIEVGPASFLPGVRYQYRLDPIDEAWSEWRDEPLLEYTNLGEGSYTFRVRARGASGETGPETTWRFAVLPPWYRTAWAIALWLLVAAGLVALLVRMRTRALYVQAEKLRLRVGEQTVALTEANARLAQLAVSDALTGIPNRREFERVLEVEWERALRHDEPLALVLLDLDHFKLLNDTHGHPAGDECLRRIGQLLAETIRTSGDVAARYGGEEFALLLPSTDTASAEVVAERLRNLIERLGIHNVTASFGVAAMIPARLGDPASLVAAADRALYAAKRAGRNCVRVEGDDPIAESYGSA